MQKELILRLLRAFLSLSIAGCLIGFLYPHDLLLATILFFLLFFRIYQESNGDLSSSKTKILLIGTFLSGSFGSLVEIWGISNFYWEYHNLSDDKTFPYWLPFAWALTFSFFYKLERDILKIVKFYSLKEKIIFISFVSALFPTFGEIITINLGVWTYSWSYQILGVPLLAILLLMLFHVGIFLFLMIYCKKNKINDVVFYSNY